jgi:repressor LexA
MKREPKGLTDNQQKVLDFIHAYVEEHGQSPTLEEIREVMGVAALRTVVQYLESIEKKGFIRRIKNMRRNIHLVDPEAEKGELISVPVFASVGCGVPSVLTERIFDEYVQVSNALVKKINKQNLFVIRAVGDSMKDAGVNNGDFVLVERTKNVQTGDRVVTIIDDTAVLKRLTVNKTTIVLESMNTGRAYPPIILSRDFEIFGKMIDVIRVSGSDEMQVVPE